MDKFCRQTPRHNFFLQCPKNSRLAGGRMSVTIVSSSKNLARMMWRLQYNNVVQLQHACKEIEIERKLALCFSVCNGVRLSVPISHNDNLQASPNALPTEWCGAEVTMSLSQLQIFRLYKTYYAQAVQNTHAHMQHGAASSTESRHTLESTVAEEKEIWRKP